MWNKSKHSICVAWSDETPIYSHITNNYPITFWKRNSTFHHSFHRLLLHQCDLVKRNEYHPSRTVSFIFVTQLSKFLLVLFFFSFVSPSCYVLFFLSLFLHFPFCNKIEVWKLTRDVRVRLDEEELSGYFQSRFLFLLSLLCFLTNHESQVKTESRFVCFVSLFSLFFFLLFRIENTFQQFNFSFLPVIWPLLALLFSHCSCCALCSNKGSDTTSKDITNKGSGTTSSSSSTPLTRAPPIPSRSPPLPPVPPPPSSSSVSLPPVSYAAPPPLSSSYPAASASYPAPSSSSYNPSAVPPPLPSLPRPPPLSSAAALPSAPVVNLPLASPTLLYAYALPPVPISGQPQQRSSVGSPSTSPSSLSPSSPSTSASLLSPVPQPVPFVDSQVEDTCPLWTLWALLFLFYLPVVVSFWCPFLCCDCFCSVLSLAFSFFSLGMSLVLSSSFPVFLQLPCIICLPICFFSFVFEFILFFLVVPSCLIHHLSFTCPPSFRFCQLFLVSSHCDPSPTSFSFFSWIGGWYLQQPVMNRVGVIDEDRMKIRRKFAKYCFIVGTISFILACIGGISGGSSSSK